MQDLNPIKENPEETETSKKNNIVLFNQNKNENKPYKEIDTPTLNAINDVVQSKPSESQYKTPNVCKEVDTSYSKLEMPVSYQLTNGKCIRLQKSEISNSVLDSEINEEISINEENIRDSTLLELCEESSESEKENKKSINKINDNKSFMNYGKKKVIYPMKFIKRHYNKLLYNTSQEESQKIRETIENKFKSYKKFNLMINPSFKYSHHFNSSPIHKFLPYCKKNDENYKHNLIKYIKQENPFISSGTRSVTGIFAKYVNSNTNEIPYNGDKDYLVNKKKKKIYSTRKIFAVEKNLYPYKLISGQIYVDYNHPIKFKFYFDNDIGFEKSWQNPLITSNGDDDVETDDEVMEMAKQKCKEDLEEGINSWNKSNRLCRNYLLVKKINNIPKSPVFNSHRIINNIPEKLKNEDDSDWNE